MGFLLSEKTYFQIPYLCRTENCFRLQRSTGPVDRVWSRSTGSVDRRAQTCTPLCTGERSTGSVDRPGELCSLEISVDRTGRPTESLLSAPVGRSTGGSNGRIFDRWRSTGPVDRQCWQNPTASFLAAYKLGFLSLFSHKILGELLSSFSHSFQKVFSIYLRANLSLIHIWRCRRRG